VAGKTTLLRPIFTASLTDHVAVLTELHSRESCWHCRVI